MKTALKRLPALAVAALVLVLGLAIVSCGGTGAAAPDAQEGAAMEEMDIGQEADDARELTLAASDTFSFAPAELTLTAGEPVRLMLNNDGVLLHDFNVERIPASEVSAVGMEMEHDEAAEPEPVEHAHANGSVEVHEPEPEPEAPDVHVAAGPGESATLEFTPTEPGTYAFYCSVAGHREAGMEGTITVQEA